MDLNDLKKEFVDMIAEGINKYDFLDERFWNGPNKQKVFILIERMDSFPNVIGVYPTKEKAFKEYQKRFVEIEANMIGVNDRAVIIERELE